MKEDKEEIFNSDHEFLAYSLPGEQGYLYREVLDYSNNKSDILHCDFVIAPFDNNFHPTYFLSLSDPIKDYKFFYLPQTMSSENGTSKELYSETFDKCKNIIQTGELDKIVLSKIKTVETDNIDIFSLFKSLVDNYPNGFVYLLNIKELGCWMGVSPELLISGNSNKYETAAIAGTQAAIKAADEVVWTSKEKMEHAIIEQYLNTKFNTVGIDFRKTNNYTYQAGAMYHIRSDYIFEAGSELSEILEMIHPGPAISGSDVPKAKSFIRNIEKHDRQLYAGYLGPILGKNRVDLYVNLRCMQIFNNQYCLYLGGGLVEDSNLNEEWQETELKASTLLSIIESNNK